MRQVTFGVPLNGQTIVRSCYVCLSFILDPGENIHGDIAVIHVVPSKLGRKRILAVDRLLKWNP